MILSIILPNMFGTSHFASTNLIIILFLIGGDSLHAGSNGKELACKAEDLGSVPGLGRSPEEGNGNPFHYSCLGNSMDRRT